MGFVKVNNRLKMHACKLEEKLGDLNLYFKPKLIIMDARKCFISNGSERGEERMSGIILRSADRLTLDIEGLKMLKNTTQKN